jgi:hypothetical protein
VRPPHIRRHHAAAERCTEYGVGRRPELGEDPSEETPCSLNHFALSFEKAGEREVTGTVEIAGAMEPLGETSGNGEMPMITPMHG